MDWTAAESLKRRLGAQAVITDVVERIPYEVDAGLDYGLPDGVVLPRTAEEVAWLATWASAHGVPLIARGAGTGLSGGAVAEGGGLIVAGAFSSNSRGVERAAVRASHSACHQGFGRSQTAARLPGAKGNRVPRGESGPALYRLQ